MQACDNCGCRGWRVFYRNKEGTPMAYICNKCGLIIRSNTLQSHWTREDAESLLTLIKARQNAE